jgi:hypothetical protein
MTRSARRSATLKTGHKRVEEGAAQRQLKRSPRRRNVTARDVKELPNTNPAEPMLQVRLTRSEVFEASTSDDRLIEEFRKRLRER